MVTAVELSQNRKVGKVSATYATQQTCPTKGEHACKLFNNGCYAENGLTAFTTNRLNRQAAAAGLDVDTIAQFEANAIDKLSGKLPLRLHVVGDCTTDKGASILSAAAARHTAKHGQKVWSYTHAWRSVAVKLGGSVGPRILRINQRCQGGSTQGICHSLGSRRV